MILMRMDLLLVVNIVVQEIYKLDWCKIAKCLRLAAIDTVAIKQCVKGHVEDLHKRICHRKGNHTADHSGCERSSHIPGRIIATEQRDECEAEIASGTDNRCNKDRTDDLKDVGTALQRSVRFTEAFDHLDSCGARMPEVVGLQRHLYVGTLRDVLAKPIGAGDAGLEDAL